MENGRVTSTIYRSPAGEDQIRQWCENQFSAWPVEHERQVLPAKGLDTHIVRAGTGPTSVVFIAGDRFSSAPCLPILTALAQHYQVIAVDVPGQPGLSSGAADASHGRLAWYGSWLDEVVENATSGPVVVFGHSFGGAVALAAGSSRIRGRLAISTGGLCSVRLTPATLLAFVGWAARPSGSSSVRLLRALSAPGSEPRADLVEWMTLVAKHTRPVSSSDLIRAPSRIPVVVATGEHDTLIPPGRLRPAARRILDVDLTVVPGGGHLVTEELPDQLVSLIGILAGG
jgi:pimeloyl-ACP methyl ester carboxylesterase